MLIEKASLTLDADDIVLAMAIGSLCLGFFQGLMSRRYQGHVAHAMRMCAYGFIAAGIGNLLICYRAFIPDLFSRAVSHTCVLIGIVGFYWATKMLKQERIPVRYCLIVVCANFLIFSWFFFVDPNLPARLIVLNLCMIAVLMPLCFTLLFEVEPQRRIIWWIAGILFSVPLLILIMRTGYLAANFHTYLPVSDGHSLPAIFFRSSYLVTLIAGIIFIVMASGETTADWSRVALQDPLTSIYNRRGFHEMAGRSLNENKKEGKTSTLLLLDLDHFKSINDRYGHAVGDIVLKRVAEAIKSQLRDEDLLGRYGGEEFLVLLPGTTRERALLVAERLRETIQSLSISVGDSTLHLTTSIGLTTDVDRYRDIDGLVNESDRALYQAKGQGRNQVVIA